MLGIYVLVILVTLMVLFGVLVAIYFADRLMWDRQQKMIDAMCNDVVPAMYQELERRFPRMMEQMTESTIKMTKKMTEEEFNY